MNTRHFSFDLQGRKALVTGSTRGIGRAIAEALAQAGATVIVNGRSPDATAQAVAECTQQGLRAYGIDADLGDAASASTIVSQAIELLGGLDIVVNNAAISPYLGRPEKLPAEQWSQILQVNVTAPFLIAQAAGRYWIDAQQVGTIINIASIGGEVALSGLVGYCTSKAALIGMTRSLAVDWAKHAIRVNAIAPGYVETDFTERVRSLDQYYQAILDRTPLGRFAAASEIAGAAVFLASDAASYITGHVLAVDGGWLAH
jgi:NAD(P)-dependent dehydrogenase (short-subunit alcohol dehydrogenase family)